MELNQPAPDFELPDLQGVVHRLSDYRGKIVIINFWSAECPHSERVDHDLAARMDRWVEDVVLLPVAANRNEPVALLKEAADLRALPSVLLDAEQRIADLYGALTTPHVFVVDREGLLRYHGAADDVTFRQRQPTRSYAAEAVDALRDGHQPEVTEAPAYGCTIVREI